MNVLWPAFILVVLAACAQAAPPATPSPAAPTTTATSSATGSTWRLFVVHQNSNDVAVVEEPAHRIVARVAVGQNPHEIAATGDGGLLATSNFAAGTISIIDAQSLTVLATLPSAPQPHGLAVRPGTREAYITQGPSNQLNAIDLGLRKGGLG